MRVGDTVLIIADPSCFTGDEGVVVQAQPCLLLTVGDDPRSMRFGEYEVVPYEVAPTEDGGADVS